MSCVPRDLTKLFRMACTSDGTVLITGETGTGKTSLAREIHQQSQRRSGPFVVVNLATLYEGILESELFGHEKGAFTGADKKRVGKLELAQGGTLFLDEIGELSPRIQARLLEFLQSRTLTPLGSNREVHLNVRIIAATHRNLKEAVEKGQFREDLFHRLRVLAIPMQSLKERFEEFDHLVHSSLREISSRERKVILRMAPEVAEKFERYPWPGNIRELRNALEYAVISCEGNELTLSDLPSWLLEDVRPKASVVSPEPTGIGVAESQLPSNYREILSKFEKEYLQNLLNRNGGRISKTARQIGLSKSTLLRRVREYALVIP